MTGGQSADIRKAAAADLWRHTLSQVPSVFGRLVLLASLRDPNSGRYEHHGMSLRFGKEESHEVLRESHSQAFEEWLCFTLQQQKADLDLYLSSLEGNKKKTIEAWLSLKPYKNILPAPLREAETRLYLADFAALLEMLRAECGAVLTDPDA